MPPFDQLILHTDRLRLRPLQPGDAPALYDIFSDPVVMRYWSTGPWSSVEPAQKWITDDAKCLAAGTHLRLGIERAIEHQLIGTCTLFNFNEQCRRAELGYALARTAWGQGVMQEALCGLLRYGFETLTLNRIEADIDPRNLRSARALERLGFRKEGFLRERWIIEGITADSELFGLLRRDWDARAPTAARPRPASS